MEDIVAMGADIVTVGQHNISICLQTLIGLMANYQDVQKEAYREIKDVIGDRTPTNADKAKLPYIEAVILESLRYATLFPLGNQHCTSGEVELNGYLIPKGCLVVSNLWAISHDSRYVVMKSWLQSWAAIFKPIFPALFSPHFC